MASATTAAADELGENLIDCVRYDEVDDVTELLEVHKANVNYCDASLKTALHVAAANGSAVLVELLLRYGARQLPNEARNTPLHWAALNGHVEVAKLLLAAGGDLEAKNEAGETPVALAHKGGKDDMGFFLADAMIQVEEARSSQGAGAHSGDGSDVTEAEDYEDDPSDVPLEALDLSGAALMSADEEEKAADAAAPAAAAAP
jgi:ankyrin repeat protein